jgi:signal transduction histidine kinase
MRIPADLPARYAVVVESYLAGGGERTLRAAHQLGREALEAGLGPLVLYSIHRDVVNALAAEVADFVEFTREVTTVFVEMLQPFELAYADVEEARTAAAELRSLIDRQADELGALDRALEEVEQPAQGLARVRSVLERHGGELEQVRERLAQAAQGAGAGRQMVSNIVAAQEQERRRLAGEIHDDALQAMAAVLLRLGTLSRHADDPGQRAALDQLEASTLDAIARLRRLLAGLHPKELEHAGLSRAVAASLDALERDFAIAGRLVDKLTSEPGPEASTIAFRVIQEALINTRKHADASRVEVALEQSDRGLLVRITDDGAGFDVDTVARHPVPGHLGVASMRERARLAGGRLTIRSRRGMTSVELWLPDTTTAADAA